MAKRGKRERLILAKYPTSRGFGFVVLEGRHQMIDWGTKEARGDKNRVALAKAAELISWYRPDLLILEDAEQADSRRSDRIQNLHRQLAGLATARKTAVRQFTRSKVKAGFASQNASTRYEIAQAVSRELPELATWLPRPKKIWESEDRKLSIFDAASLALTFYETQKSGTASQHHAES